MLNLYDPAMSPSTVVVKLMTGKKSRNRGHAAADHNTQNQVLFLMEPVLDNGTDIADKCEVRAARRAA